TITSAITDKSRRKAAEKKLQDNDQILSDLTNPEVELNEEQRTALMDAYNRNDTEVREYVRESEAEKGRLNENQRAMLESMSERRAALESMLENEGLSDGTKSTVEAQVSELDESIDNLTKEASNELPPER